MICTVAVVASLVVAQADAPRALRRPADPDVEHTISITFSPVHLVLPILEVTGEYRLDDKMGAAAIVGAGQVLGFTAFELGGQFRYYVLGSFIHGMQLGAEVLGESLSGTALGANASGLGITASPFVGYKIATNIGFTFDMQVGVSFFLVGAQASSGGQTATASNNGILPLLNLNVGWSFGAPPPAPAPEPERPLPPASAPPPANTPPPPGL